MWYEDEKSRNYFLKKISNSVDSLKIRFKEDEFDWKKMPLGIFGNGWNKTK